MQKIRTQLMLDYDLFQKLITLQGHTGAKTVSILVNKLLTEAFEYQKRLEQRNKTIESLQNVITDMGVTAENYRAQIIAKGKVLKDESK